MIITQMTNPRVDDLAWSAAMLEESNKAWDAIKGVEYPPELKGVCLWYTSAPYNERHSIGFTYLGHAQDYLKLLKQDRARAMLERIKKQKKDDPSGWGEQWLKMNKADDDYADAKVVGERLWNNVNDLSSVEDEHIMADMEELFRYAWPVYHLTPLE